MGKNGGFLNPLNDAVKGTGQSVGDLQNVGYSDGEINDMGTGGMNKFMRGMMKGGLLGTAGAMNAQSQQQGGQPVQFSVPQQPTVNFEPSDYLQKERERRMKQSGLGSNNAFYGG